jgi:Flp pilus assembly protein TadG
MLTRAGRFISRFARAHGGLAATEFALLLPAMLTLYFGVTEVADGLIANAKTSSLAATAADLAAQNDKLCNSEMDDIFAALNAIMFPYPTANTKVVISSLYDAGSNQIKVGWSDALNGTPRTVGSVVTIPTGLVTSGSGESVILAEVTYNYSSPAGELIYGTIQMNDTFYVHPRRVKIVTRTTSTCT